MQPRLAIYLLREILPPMLLGWLLFSAILLLGKLLKMVELVVGQGVAWQEVAWLFFTLIPDFLVLTLPLGFLLGVLVGCSRLSASGETIALRALGISPLQLLVPVLALALLLSAVGLGLSHYGRPWARQQFKQQLFTILKDQASVGLQGGVFNQRFPGLMLYARDIDNRSGQMNKLLLWDRRQNGQPLLITAEAGRLQPLPQELKLRLELHNGSIHRYQTTDPKQAGYDVITFNRYQLRIDLSNLLPRRDDLDEDELYSSQLQQRLRQNPPDSRRYRELHSQWHQRWALPFSHIIFALLALPLGIYYRRGGRGGAFALALGLFLSYYLSLSFMETLCIEHQLTPWPWLWLPNLGFGLAGLLVFYRHHQEGRWRFFRRCR